MEIRVLGPIAVVDDGDSVSLGGPRQQAVLAVLVAFAGEMVSTDRLIDEIWGEDPPPAAKNSLQSMVSNLRRILSPDDAITIERTGPGYVLRCPEDRIDAVVLAEEIDQGRALLSTDPPAAASALDRSLARRHGIAYAGVADDVPVLHAEQVRLEQLHLRALGYRIEADLEIGRHGEVIGELDGLVDAHPLHEEFTRLQMLALYRSGRQSDALRSLARLRRVLGEELGIDPSPDLRELEQRILDQDASLLVAGSPEDRRTDLPNPYKGLRAFGERDVGDFFGRDALTREIAESVLNRAVTVLVGPSGSGKSSLVGAGVLPAVRTDRPDWLIATMYPGSRPHEELEAALLRAAPGAPAALPAILAGEGGLRRATNALVGDDGCVVLAIDQAEELLALVDDPERDRFVTALQQAVDAGRMRLVMTLRSDFLGDALSHPRIADLLRTGTVLVPPMTASEIEEAIVRPAARVGAEVDGSLVVAAVADVQGRPGALPMLQHALTLAFERRESDRLTAAEYRSVGGVTEALANSAAGVLAALDGDQREIVRQVFLRLVVPGDGSSDTRRRVPVADLEGLGRGAVAVGPVVDAFVAARLLVLDVDPASGSPTVEVAHESLFTQWPELRNWIEEARDDLRVSTRLRALADEWDGAGRSEGLLLRGDHLARFTSWRDTTQLSVDAMSLAFLIEGESLERRAEAAAARRRRRIVTALSGAATISLVLALLAAVFGLRASDAARLARSRAVAGQAIAQIQGDQDLALLLAIEAVEIEPTAEALEALHRAVAVHRLLAAYPATGLSAAWVDDRRIATLQSEGTVSIIEVGTGEQVAALGPLAGSVGGLGTTSAELSVSGDGRRLGAALPDGTVDVWSLDSLERLWTAQVGAARPSLTWHPTKALVAARATDRSSDEIDVSGSVDTGVAVGAIRDADSGEVVADLVPCFCPAEIGFDDLGRLWLQTESRGLVPGASLGALVETESGEWEVDGRLTISAPLADQVAASGTRVVVSLGTVARAATFSGSVSATFSAHGADVRDIVAGETRAVSGGDDGRVRVWSMETGEEEMALAGHDGVVVDVDLSTDGLRAVTVDAGGTARIWDIADAAVVEIERFQIGEIGYGARFGAFTAGGTGLVVGVVDFLASTPSSLFELRALDPAVAVFVERSGGDLPARRPEAQSLEGERLPFGYMSFDTDPETSTFSGAAGFYGEALFTSGGLEVFLASELDWEPPFEVPGSVAMPMGPPLATALSAEADRVVAAGCGDVDETGCVGEAYLADAPLVSGFPDLDDVKSLAIGTGVPIAVGTTGGLVAGLVVDSPSTPGSAEVVVWDPSTGGGRRWQVEPDATVLAFHDQVVVVGDARGQVTFFDVEANVRSVNGAHIGGVSSLAVDAERGLLVSAGRGGRVAMWDLLTGQEIYTIRNGATSVLGIGLDPVRQELSVASADGTVDVLTYDLDRLLDIARSRVTRELTQAECDRYLQQSCS